MNVSIIGATGYAGEELFRLLLSHPKVNIKSAVSKSFAGQRIKEIYPSLDTDLTLDGDNEKAYACDIVFTALPHGSAQTAVAEAHAAGAKVIDLSADFRYEDISIYEQWYGAHTQKHLKSAYGLCELYRDDIAKANIVGNPGCYTTCSILALYPLLSAGVIDTENIIIDAASGVSGAGRKESLSYAYCETADNFKAYSVTTHRHTSEIEEQLSMAAGKTILLSFTPHLLPVKRGILSTIYANTLADDKAIAKAYERYADEKFVKVVNRLPELKDVVGSNCVKIGYVLDKRLKRLVIVSCIDNLMKGAAGQAVQNMNIMCGFSESEGLSSTAWYL